MLGLTTALLLSVTCGDAPPPKSDTPPGHKHAEPVASPVQSATRMTVQNYGRVRHRERHRVGRHCERHRIFHRRRGGC